jgi:hypothetical protein
VHPVAAPVEPLPGGMIGEPLQTERIADQDDLLVVGADTKPFTVRVNQRLMVDQEMIEFICNENERSTLQIEKPK